MSHFIELRYANDGANNFGNWRQLDLGDTGDFIKPLVARRLGRCRHRVWETRDTSSLSAAILAAMLYVRGEWVPFALPDGTYSDSTRPWTRQDVCNYLPTFAEAQGTRSPIKYMPVPGLELALTVGAGPHRGGRDVEGVRFVVSGTKLYKLSAQGVATELGTIPGTGLVSMTHNQVAGGNQVVIGTGDNSYVYDTSDSTFTANGVGLQSVDFLDQVVIGIEPQRRFFRWSDLANAKSFPVLNNESAESSPDRVVGDIVSQGELLIFGERTIEPWRFDPTETATFQRSSGAIAEKGCINANTLKRLDNSVFFVDNNFIPCRLQGYTPVPIAPKAIVDEISRCDPAKLFALTWEDKGYVCYYVCSQDGRTWGYDVTSQKWHRRESFGLDRWRLNTLFKWNGDWYGGDYASGKLYKLVWGYAFEGCEIMPRGIRTGVLHNNGNPLSIDGFKLLMDSGGPESLCAPVISYTIGTFPDTCDDADYSQVLTISEGSGPYTNARIVGTAPAGTTLTIDGSDITIEFSDATAGDYSFGVTVDDANGRRSPPLTVSFTVHNFQITGSLPDGSDSVTYSELLTLSDGTAPYGTPTITAGALPSGGAVEGVGDSLRYTWPAAAAGTYNFTTSITDALGCTATSAQEVVIAASGAIACGVDSSYTGGQTYPTVIPITLGSATGLVTVTWGFGLPDKLEIWLDGILRLATGYQGHAASHTYAQDQTLLDAALDAQASPRQTLIYPETSPGSFYKGTATSVAEARVYGPIAGTAWEFNCGCPDTGVTSGALTISSIERLPKVGYTTPHAYATHGGTEPYTFSVLSGSLPTGRTVNATTGEETGTYTAAGTYTFTIRVTDAVAAHADVACSVTVVTNF